MRSIEAVYTEEKIHNLTDLPKEWQDPDPVVWGAALYMAHSGSEGKIKALRYSFEWQVPDFKTSDYLMTMGGIMFQCRSQIVSFEFVNEKSPDPEVAELWMADISSRKAYGRQIKSGEDLKLPILRMSGTINGNLSYYLFGPQTCKVTVVDYQMKELSDLKTEPWDPLAHGYQDVSVKAFGQ